MLSAVLFTVLIGQAAPAEPAKFTDEQIVKLRDLVRTTQTREAEIRTKLENRQKALTDLYADYHMNMANVTKVEGEILSLQKELLGVYQTMQVELRAIVDEHQYKRIKARLDYMFGKLRGSEPAAPTATTTPAAKPAVSR